ncbi:hypothetical protein [Candidatus Chrysopegis kryptomonas]|uniref:hypothetical protein n=1 Tax=Candidatus Chryseopegocella kryptomonas TaxID=1633643 RepID=UPI00135207A3|nr:hypothetical protein [Candidatus Chrysopegis kryptomonas]
MFFKNSKKITQNLKEKEEIGVDDVLKYAEKVGFLVLAVGTEVKNTKGFKPKEW